MSIFTVHEPLPGPPTLRSIRNASRSCAMASRGGRSCSRRCGCCGIDCGSFWRFTSWFGSALKRDCSRSAHRHFVSTLVPLFISLLVGLEASTLRRFTLSRRGWRNVGVISGDDLEDAERRFFDAWLRDTPVRPSMPSAPGSSAPGSAPSTPQPPTPRMPQASDVIGLFPQPGAQR